MTFKHLINVAFFYAERNQNTHSFLVQDGVIHHILHGVIFNYFCLLIFQINGEKRTVFTRSQFMVKSCSSPSPRVQYATSRKCKGNIHKAYSLRMMHTPHAPPCAPPPWKPRDAHLFLYKCARPKSVEGTVSETTMKVRIIVDSKIHFGAKPLNLSKNSHF